MKIKITSKGFTLVEILIALALVAILIPAFITALHFSIFTSGQGDSFSRAYALAQEQMEVIYLLKNEGGWTWDDTSPLNTAPGSYYQPVKSGNTWTLGSMTSAPIPDGFYTKKVEIKPIMRDAAGVINGSPPLTDDNENSRFVTVYVKWKENGITQEVKLESIITKY